MALLADGWHMGTHVAGLGITAVAYRIARRYAADARFAFGTFKVEVLGGFASAIVLAMVALYIAADSVTRLLQPLTIRYTEALCVAVLGLLVNLASAFLLQGRDRPDAEPAAAHDHGHDHGYDHHHGDLNWRAAYLHVLADAATSVLAIFALTGGLLWSWAWLDPLMGIVGAGMISSWAYGLLRDTSRILLDLEMDHEVTAKIREALEADGDAKVADLHIWRVGRARFACAVALVAERPRSPEEYRARLRKHEQVAHTTIEVLQCHGHGNQIEVISTC